MAQLSANPWGELDELLALAPLPNVYVTLCGAPVLCDRQYPFDDIWPNIHRLLAAFGIGRVMWASDVGRFQGRIGRGNKFEVAHAPYPGKHHYADALYSILHTTQLSASEKEEFLGGTARRLTGWSPCVAGAGQGLDVTTRSLREL